MRDNPEQARISPAAAAPKTAVPARPPSRYWPWKVVAFLFAATLLSYLDRQALSVVASRVAGELGLDNAGLGLLLSAFFWSYALMHLLIGWPLDRFNLRLVYPLFVALWSLAQIRCGTGLVRRSGAHRPCTKLRPSADLPHPVGPDGGG